MGLGAELEASRLVPESPVGIIFIPLLVAHGLGSAMPSVLPLQLTQQALRVTVERVGEGKEWDPLWAGVGLPQATLATGQGYVGGLPGKEAAASQGCGL